MDVRVDGDSVQLALTAQGEAHFDEVVQAGVPAHIMSDWGERLRSDLVDFVAGSRCGWGQNQDDTSINSGRCIEDVTSALWHPKFRVCTWWSR